MTDLKTNVRLFLQRVFFLEKRRGDISNGLELHIKKRGELNPGFFHRIARLLRIRTTVYDYLHAVTAANCQAGQYIQGQQIIALQNNTNYRYTKI